MKAKLEAAGVHCSDVVDHGFIHSIYSFDPNGIAIEFTYNVEGIDIHATPFMRDAEAPESAKEGPEPQPGHWPKAPEPVRPSERHVRPGAGSNLCFKT